jgi:hypothetical protein
VREEELAELDELSRNCAYQVKGGAESKVGKVSILMQVRTAVEAPFKWFKPVPSVLNVCPVCA